MNGSHVSTVSHKVHCKLCLIGCHSIAKRCRTLQADVFPIRHLRLCSCRSVEDGCIISRKHAEQIVRMATVVCMDHALYSAV